MSSLIDTFGRRLNYMRISITDRCDLRCIYCTAHEFEPVGQKDVLSYEEIERIVRAGALLGVTKVRLTGGEPLTRRDLDQLIEKLANIQGIEEISLTTNGTRLAQNAFSLRKAGLKRVNISLDSLQSEKFRKITGGDKLADVLAGIDAANRAGLIPVKINMVVLKGINDDEIPDFVRKTMVDGWHVRFIEHMPFCPNGTSNQEILSSDSIKSGIEGVFGKLIPQKFFTGNGPASYYRLERASGTIGFISPVTDCFCEGCNRFRLTADGKLRPCLLDDDEIDIKEALRKGADITELADIIKSTALIKQQKHHLDSAGTFVRRPMRQIGG